MPLRCILFDAVGTLLFADPPVAEVYTAVGARHGCRLPLATVEQRFGVAFARSASDDGIASGAREHERWRAVVGEVFQEWPHACEAILAELWNHFSLPTAWRLFDDAAPVLAELRASGWQLGVASNFDERLVNVSRGHAPLADLPLFWSSDIGYSKPHPSFFAGVAERLCLGGGEILLVGDDFKADVQGARAAGWQAVLVDRGLSSSSASAICTLADLPRLLASTALAG